MTWNEWVATVKRSGGIATVWPFKTGIYGIYAGQPAARYSTPAYAKAYGAGQIDPRAPQQTTTQFTTEGNAAWVYVLAPADVRALAPESMTWAQRLEYHAILAADRTAETLGLPSLAGLERVIVGGLAVLAAIAVAAMLPHLRGWRSAS